MSGVGLGPFGNAGQPVTFPNSIKRFAKNTTNAVGNLGESANKLVKNVGNGLTKGGKRKSKKNTRRSSRKSSRRNKSRSKRN
jgi:hypothetical protein